VSAVEVEVNWVAIEPGHEALPKRQALDISCIKQA